jgi:hypothetical protein
LLLGTGPLVDPGFAGRLFIPLHNLTSEPYTLIGGEGLIWVEFTKISPHSHWTKGNGSENGYNHFPKKNRYLTPEQYLNKIGLNGNLPRSSIPLEIKEAVEVSKEAENIASKTDNDVREELRKIYKRITIGSIATLTIAVIAAVYPIFALIQDANKYVRESAEREVSLEKIVDEQKILISNLSKKLTALEAKTDRIAEDAVGTKP